MPFNGSGTFTIVNTFVPSTTILSSAVNANFTDIATGLSDCLTRDNQAGMSAVFRAVSGSVSAPGIAFTSDTTSGLYLSASGIPGFVSHSLGMLLNTTNYAATSATVSAGGSGYAVGDTITLTGGTAVSQPVFTVATLSGSAVATVTVGYPGSYSVKPSNPVAQGSTSGSGTSCTLTVTYNDPSSADYRAIFTDQAAALIWQKMGSSSFVSGLMAKAKAYDFVKSLVTISTGLSMNTTTDPPTLTAPATPVPGGFSNLSIKVASNTTVTCAASFITVTDGTNYQTIAFSGTVNLGTNGAVNALDAGTIAINTWYAIWAIAKSDGTQGFLASTSATSPTLPTGYTYKARVGWVQTINGSATLYGTWQLGRRASYVVGLAQTSVIPVMSSGVQGSGIDSATPTWQAVAMTRFAPTTASEINGTMHTAGANIAVAPSNGYAGRNQTNGPPFSVTSATNVQSWFSMLLESTNIYWISDGASNQLLCQGWVDNLT